MLRLLPRSPVGLLGAALFWLAGLAPSLLPRPTVVAVGLAGLLGALGYGGGAAVEALAGRYAEGPRVRRGLLVLAGVAWVVVLVQSVLAAQWQTEQAQALGMTPASTPWWLVLVGGLLVMWLLVGVGRGLRWIARAAGRLAGRHLPTAAARAVGVVASVGAVVVVVGTAYLATSAVFGSINDRGSGAPPPTSTVRSGGPGSLVSYSGLGAEGQQFVDGGPSVYQLSVYAGTPATEPVRVYVGLGNASTPEERATLAVQELQRTGAFERRLLVVAITTGNGYLDPSLVSAPELLTGGDVATVSTQYSVLPSWLSFLVDQKAAGAEAQALWSAVRAAVEALPADQRPLLATSGESLGAFGGQAPFAGLDPAQVAAQADAAVWVGSPGASAVWPVWRDGRTAGPAWEPQIGDDSIARDPATAESGAWSRPGWGSRRVVLTQHANDPVSWWSVPLLWQRPDWLDDPRGPGTDPRMTWWPGVFFLQTGLDLAAAGAVPAGVGHNHGEVTGQAWAFALDAPGSSGAWSAADTARLDEALG